MKDAMKDVDPDLKSYPTSKRSKWLVVGGVVAALLVCAGVALGVAIPLTRKDNGKGSSSSSASVSSESSEGMSPIQMSSKVKVTGPVRTYYIAAEFKNWNYSPMDLNNCTGEAYDAKIYDALQPNKTVQKAVFRLYQDEQFEVELPRPDDESHLGYFGPVIRAEEGDFIRIVLYNALNFDVNLMPSGMYTDQPTTASPGDRIEYIWAVGNNTLPKTPNSPSSQMWIYRSTVDLVTHLNAGLVGPIVITRKGAATADAKPTGVDRELFLFFHVTDEGSIPMLNANEAEASNSRRLQQASRKLQQSIGQKHGINGFMFCNMPNLTAQYGEKVRWYVAGLGNEVDIHVAHWHGITLLKYGHRVDQVQLLPGVTHTLDSTADNPGTWLLHCHVNSHLVWGMTAFYHISGPPPKNFGAPEKGGVVRKYYISADLVEWDYAPSGANLCGGQSKPVNFTEDELVFMGRSKNRIGRKYLKAQYREYTDATFTKIKPRPASERHLGLQGPLLRAEVGDAIQILFRNALPEHAVSIHPHGVLYTKAGEGAPYHDGTTGAATADDRVAPNKTTTYRWTVPDRAGPGPSDPSSLLWMYHSHMDERRDTYAGLFGGIIVTRKGAAKPSGAPRDVDTELVFFFGVMDETAGILLQENAEKYLGLAKPLQKLEATEGAAKRAARLRAEDVVGNPVLDDVNVLLFAKDKKGAVDEAEAASFVESNLMHAINGYSYCNLPDATVTVGQRVRTYFMTLGETVDIHAPVMFATTFEEEGRSQQGLQLLPGSMITTDVRPVAAGSWVLQCQVDDHVLAGMRALVKVQPAVATPKLGVAAAGASATVRRFYIAAEEVEWDFAPLGKDGCTGNAWTFTQQTYTKDHIGSKYRKALYVQYTDATWKTKVQQPDVHGYLGPFIKAEVGDVVEVVFRNSLKLRASLTFLGGLVPTDPAGKLTVSQVHDVLAEGVAPGKSLTTRWLVPAAAGPVATDAVGVVGYTYASGVDQIAMAHAGLVGMAAVGRKGVFGKDGEGLPEGMDYLVPLLFTIDNENESPYYPVNEKRMAAKGGRRLAGRAAGGGRDLLEGDLSEVEESNMKHVINGRLYCNTALKVRTGSKGVLVFGGLGSEGDMHSPVFEGQLLEEAGHKVLAAALMPATTRVAVLHAEAPGTWRGYCMVIDHVNAGMMMAVQVGASGGNGTTAGRRLLL